MTLACPDCQTPWTDSKAANCATCGTVAVAEIIAGIRRRYPVWNDAAAFEDWILRNAKLVASGAVCDECGTIWDMDDPPRGTRRRCLTCSCGYGPGASRSKQRAPRRRKGVATHNMELLG